MGITISRIVFDGPYSLSSLEPSREAVLYTILYKREGNWNVAYVGEANNLDESTINSHHKRGCWIERAGSESDLYIATYPVPDSTEKQRRVLVAKMKFENEPPCND